MKTLIALAAIFGGGYYYVQNGGGEWIKTQLETPGDGPTSEAVDHFERFRETVAKYEAEPPPGYNPADYTPEAAHRALVEFYKRNANRDLASLREQAQQAYEQHQSNPNQQNYDAYKAAWERYDQARRAESR